MPNYVATYQTPLMDHSKMLTSDVCSNQFMIVESDADSNGMLMNSDLLAFNAATAAVVPSPQMCDVENQQHSSSNNHFEYKHIFTTTDSASYADLNNRNGGNVFFSNNNVVNNSAGELFFGGTSYFNITPKLDGTASVMNYLQAVNNAQFSIPAPESAGAANTSTNVRPLPSTVVATACQNGASNTYATVFASKTTSDRSFNYTINDNNNNSSNLDVTPMNSDAPDENSDIAPDSKAAKFAGLVGVKHRVSHSVKKSGSGYGGSKYMRKRKNAGGGSAPLTALPIANPEDKCDTYYSATQQQKQPPLRHSRASSASLSLDTADKTLTAMSNANEPRVLPLGRCCHSCATQINDRTMLCVDGHVYHAECLKCTACATPMDDCATCFQKRGALFCRDCYTKKFRNRCTACNRQIQPTDWVRRARDSTYHLACFACEHCKRQLSTGEQFSLQDDRLLCKQHYLELVRGEDCSSKQKAKRVRTTFAEEQLGVLQAHFRVDCNPDGADLERIAQLTGLSKRVTQVWFQNSRARQKKYLVIKKEGGGGGSAASVASGGADGGSGYYATTTATPNSGRSSCALTAASIDGDHHSSGKESRAESRSAGTAAALALVSTYYEGGVRTSPSTNVAMLNADEDAMIFPRSVTTSADDMTDICVGNASTSGSRPTVASAAVQHFLQ